MFSLWGAPSCGHNSYYVDYDTLCNKNLVSKSYIRLVVKRGSESCLLTVSISTVKWALEVPRTKCCVSQDISDVGRNLGPL